MDVDATAVPRRRTAARPRSAPSRSPRRPMSAPGALLALLAVLAVGCSGAAPSAGPPAPVPSAAPEAPGPSPRPLVVASTSILGDVTAALVGDDLDLVVLMGPDVDPHDFALSAAEAARLRDAALVVANGLGLEPGIDAALEAAQAEGAAVLRVAELVDPLPFVAHDGEDAHGHGGEDADAHDHGELDPHFWWDPSRMATAVEAIAAELASVDGVDAAALAARRDDYLGRLAAAEAEMERTLAAVPEDRRRIVTNHDALGYLAARFDLEVVGTVIPGASTDVAADAASFAALVETVDALGVEVVFADNTDSVALAEQLASELVGRRDLELRVVRLNTDALGPDGSGAETYLGLLVTGASTIAEALG